MLLLAQMGGKICETWIQLVAQSACDHAAEIPSCPITLTSKDALCSALCSGFGDGAKAVRGPWVPLAGLAPPVARHKDHKAWCQLTLPSIPLRVWKYPGSPSWALVPSKTCLQCTSACMHCSKKKKQSFIVVRVHLINLFLFCQCRRYAVSSQFFTQAKKRTWIYMEIICLDTPRKEDEEAIEGQRKTAHELRSKGFWCENEQRFQWCHSVLRDSPVSYPVKALCRQCRQRRTEWVGVKKKM